MNRNSATILALAMSFVLLSLIVSCAGKTSQTSQEVIQPPLAAEPKAPAPVKPPEPVKQAAPTMAEDDKTLFVNDRVHFDFDSHILSEKAQQILTQKAEYLISHPDIKIIVEGHCDERGTAAYNVALGERRAESAKEYLVYLGISPTRLDTISYGEEKPIEPARSETAWSKNRRAEFVIR